MEDILDDDLEAQEAFSQEIHTQAAGKSYWTPPPFSPPPQPTVGRTYDQSPPSSLPHLSLIFSLISHSSLLLNIHLLSHFITAVRSQRLAAAGAAASASNGSLHLGDGLDDNNNDATIASVDQDETEKLYQDLFLSERQRDERKSLPLSLGGNDDMGEHDNDISNDNNNSNAMIGERRGRVTGRQSRLNRQNRPRVSVSDGNSHSFGNSSSFSKDEVHEEVDFEAMAAHDPALRKLIDDIDARDRERRDKGRLSRGGMAAQAQSQPSQHERGGLSSSSSSSSSSSLPRREQNNSNNNNNNNEDAEFDKYIASVSEEDFNAFEDEQDDEAAFEGDDDIDNDEEALFTSADKSFLDDGAEVADRSPVRGNGKVR